MGMKVSELKPGSSCELVGEIIKVFETRTTITKYGKKLKVCNIVMKDESGQVDVTLWNQETAIPQAGRQLEIRNGYVREYMGKLCVSTGKDTTLQLI